jgi:UDP-N-acetylglucosamine--N-acetylmuramyl-(pentapeptide) pyrophosphoryl-undecaprenol N-acetylglucosamine transferase
MPLALSRLASRFGNLEVLHQAGRGRDADVRSSYARLGMGRAEVTEFIDDVVRAIADADLVVARAGAATIAELTAIGRASVLVPFPFAADDHQAKNAASLERAGGTFWLRQDAATPEALAAAVERLLSDDSARVAMADAARACGRPTAARDIAADLLSLASVESRKLDQRDGTNGVHLVPSRVN